MGRVHWRCVHVFTLGSKRRPLKSFFHFIRDALWCFTACLRDAFPSCKASHYSTNSYHRSIVCSKKVLIALNEATVPITQTPRCSREHAIDGVIIHCKHKQTIDLTSVDHPVRGSYLTPSCHTFWGSFGCNGRLLGGRRLWWGVRSLHL